MPTLAEVFPELAKQWDYEKNGDLTPEIVSSGSNKKVWWICPKCGQSYQKRIGNRTAPSKRSVESDKCPICLGRVIIPGFNSLKAKYPDIIAREWDFDKNTIEPDTIPPSYRKKMWWICPNGHNHSYLATIAYRVSRNSVCAVCHGKQVAPDTSFAALFPEMAKEWSEENDKKPTEVAAGSDYVALWKCPNPNHPPYRQKVQFRSRGCGCVYCNRYGKKHPKDFEDELKSKHPHIRLLSQFTRMSDNLVCQCEICGYIWKPTGNSVLKGKGCPKCRYGS